MQILFKMTITSTGGNYDPHIKAVDIQRRVEWLPDVRMPVKDDVILFGDMSKAVEEVHFQPLGSGPYVIVYLENFIDPDPDECAEVDFPDWTKE